MPYIEERCKAGKTVEVAKYFSYHIGKHWIRAEYQKPSTEAVKKANKKQALIKLRRLMNGNFEDGKDCLLTMTFKPEEKPETYKDLLAKAQLFVRRLRKEYKQAGIELKYIYVLERGERGACHIHMVCSWNNVSIFWKCWSWGYIKVEPLGSDGQYAKIAEYFLKYAGKTQGMAEAEGEKIGRSWYPSQNLIHPVAVKKIIKAQRFKTDPHVPKGYYLDKDSVFNGASVLTGLPVFAYTLIRMRC